MHSKRIATVEVSPREFLRISDVRRFEDGSGYVATVEVSVEKFACYPRSFYFDDLKGLIAKLRAAFTDLTGRVEFGWRYEPDRLCLEFLPNRGHVLISGDFGRADGKNSQLLFAFEADQTYIGPFLEALEQISGDVHV